MTPASLVATWVSTATKHDEAGATKHNEARATKQVVAPGHTAQDATPRGVSKVLGWSRAWPEWR